MSQVTYFEGSTPAVGWKMSGPRILVDPGAGQRAWETRLRAGLQDLAASLKRAAQGAYSDSQTIREGFHSDTQTQPYVRVRLTNQVPLFGLVEYPTRPHVIAATRGPWLRFPFPDGHWVQVREVHHPGTKGRRAIDPIFAEYDPQFAVLLDRATAEMLDA